jgi:YesN/AraC family two-component response regulator
VTDLFGSNHDSGSDLPHVDPNKNYVEELVGESKKFKTVEELARGKYEADQFIERLKQEQAALREELNSRKRLEEVADLLSSQQKNQSIEGQPPARDDGDKNTALTPEQLEKMLEERLTKREQQQVRDKNINTVKEKLTEAFGQNYAAKLQQEANALGVSKEYLTNLAAESPSAFFRLVGLDASTKQQQGNLFSPPASSVNQAAFAPNVTGERTMSYYDKLKNDDPRTYWSPKVQNEMHRDAQRLGAKFFDRK